jgi:two-component system sensor histidine kinase CpxA
MKLFGRIFLSFWLATMLMIGTIVCASEVFPLIFPEEQKLGFQPESAQADLAKAVNIYEKQGAKALASALRDFSATRHRRVYLFQQDGKPLVGNEDPPLFYEHLAMHALQTGHEEMRRYLGSRLLFVCPVQSATGRNYAVVMTAFAPGYRLLRLRFWFDLMIAMFPAALVCMALSLYLTRPITRLRASAKRLAGGDLSARSSPRGIVRRDELGDLARDFDAMAAQIQLLMTAQRRFVADVSHELGAPLTRLHLALALLRRQSAGNSNVELERIERETSKLSNLVQQLLLLAGLEAGSYPVESLVPVSIGSLCGSIIEDANFVAELTHCRVLSSGEDTMLPAYPQLLRRAIDNVLRNALRYAPPGSEILLNWKVDRDLQLVVLEILDSGPGVPEPMLKDIFRPFFRTSPGRESNTGGTGLGLAIATEAVRMHDGAIAARNRPGGGLQVTITLPLRTPESKEEPGYTVDEA